MTHEVKQNPDVVAQATPLPRAASLPPVLSGKGVVLKTGNAKSGLIVYSFTDYREFIREWFREKQEKNPAFSASAFARKAGLGENSRGYMKLIVEGKRNLTQHTVRTFAEAMGLNPRASEYFENLVFFNQAKTPTARDHYFKKLSDSADGHETEQFELMKSQYQLCTRWYYIVVRELVVLKDFSEDPVWIAAKLRNKITRKEAEEALMRLIHLGLLVRDTEGKLKQSQPLIKFSGGFFNSTVQHFHAQMMERAKEALFEDVYGDWHASGLTLSCDERRYKDLTEDINKFRDDMNVKYGVADEHVDSVIQVNFQAVFMTPKNTKTKGEGK